MDLSRTSPTLMYLTLLLSNVFLGCCHLKKDGDNIADSPPKENAALQKAVQSLLGLGSIPASDFDLKMAPKYMLDLYEQYKNGQGKQLANTVRSIQAEIGVINTESMFVFNLSSILSSEKILKAEVHLYKHKMKESKAKDMFMEMHELGPNFLRKLDHRRIPEVSYGWQAADVTSAVVECLHQEFGPPRMMALSFSFPKRHELLHPLSARQLIRRISRPYLIIFSNDTQNISVDHIQPHLKPADLTSTYVDPSTGELERFSKFGINLFHNSDPDENSTEDNETDSTDTKLETETDEDNVKPNDKADDTSTFERKWLGKNKLFEYLSISLPKQNIETSKSLLIHPKEKVHNEVEHRRLVRRSVVDNEIPEDPDEELIPGGLYDMPKTHPGILQDRTRVKHKNNKKSGKLIPYPDNYKKQRRKQRKNHRNSRRNKKEKHRTDKIRKDWDIESIMDEHEKEQLCSKKTLSVDFADIGWNEWIISPRSFEANYCSGSCPFPLSQKLRPSNHATIQSLVNAIGLHSHVPGPCCVPEKLSAVTLLYFDESKNVVLKNYPEMSVDSCACR